MSGGSYDYAYVRIEDLASEIRGTTPLRRAFAAHLLKVAQACHDIEWVDSGDYDPGDEEKSIKECFGKAGPRLTLTVVMEEARRIKAELERVMKEVGDE